MADVSNIKINGTTYSVKDSVARNAAGGPNVASTAAAMTDSSKVYVYTGSETGMTAGNWYYWNGSAWTSGGVYQSTGISTDKTLTVSGAAADAKASGDSIGIVKSDLNHVKTHIRENVDSNYLINEGVFVAEAEYLGIWYWVPYEFSITKSTRLTISCDSVEYDGTNAPSILMRVERYNGSTRLAYGDIAFSSLPFNMGLEAGTDKIIIRICINMAGPATNMKATLHNFKVINGDVGIEELKNDCLGSDVLIPKGTYTITTAKGTWTGKTVGFLNAKKAKAVRIRYKSLTFDDTPITTNSIGVSFHPANDVSTGTEISYAYIHGVYDNDRTFEIPSNTAAIGFTIRTNTTEAKNTSVTVEDLEVTYVGSEGVANRVNTLDGNYSLPDYYYANSYLTDKATTIKQLLYDADGQYDAAIFITDIHWEENALNSPALIRWLTDRINIPKLIIGGDLYNGWSSDKTTDALDQLKKAFGREKDTYVCVGNHEFNHVGSGWSGGGLTESKCWYLFNSMRDNIVPGDLSRNYYYFDNNVQKIRYIFLSSFTDKGAGELQAQALFEEAQQNWFRDVALGTMGAGWGAVIISHVIYEINAVTNEIYQDPYLVPLTTIIDNYDGPGEIICAIQGHSHRDRIVNTSGGNKVVITTCDKCRIFQIPDTSAVDLDVDRTRGTINEQAFDVFVFDRKNRKVSIVRIGAGARNGIGNDPGQQVEIRQFTY